MNKERRFLRKLSESSTTGEVIYLCTWESNLCLAGKHQVEIVKKLKQINQPFDLMTRWEKLRESQLAVVAGYAWSLILGVNEPRLLSDVVGRISWEKYPRQYELITRRWFDLVDGFDVAWDLYLQCRGGEKKFVTAVLKKCVQHCNELPERDEEGADDRLLELYSLVLGTDEEVLVERVIVGLINTYKDDPEYLWWLLSGVSGGTRVENILLDLYGKCEGREVVVKLVGDSF